MATTRRNFLKSFVAAAALAPLQACSLAARRSSNKPNVVLIFTDDQGTLDANCYGSTDLFTPAMDGLAERGVRFTQAYSHTVCCPARALLLTGRHPQRSGVNNWTQGQPNQTPIGINMALGEVTIAEALRGAGYKTAIAGKWHLGADLDHGPLEQGFDEFLGIRGGFIDNYNHYFLHGKGFHDLYDGKNEIFAPGNYFPDLTTGKALDFIDRNKRDPFFLYLAFNIPHYPEQSDPQFTERYKDLPMPRRSYAQMISTVDDHIGMVLERLDKHGLRDDTIIVFMSDNGGSNEDAFIRVDNHTSGLPKGHHYGAFGGGHNTGKWIGHKGTFLEGGIRVPAIISYPPALPEGVVRDQAITGADWLPTILDLCGVPLPDAELDGQSLLPIIASAEAPTHHKIMHWQWQAQWAVRQGPWKLIGRGKQNLSLGNLDDAKPEEKNYLKEKPELVTALRELHDQWAKEVTPQ